MQYEDEDGQVQTRISTSREPPQNAHHRARADAGVKSRRGVEAGKMRARGGADGCWSGRAAGGTAGPEGARGAGPALFTH